MITVDGIQVSFSQLRQKWRDGSVVVFNGDYHSSGLLTVDKSVTIRGGVFAQINVTAPNVVIEEVTVRDSIASAWNGAISVRANGCVVRKSHIYNAMNVNVFGILALNVDGCVVEGCEVHDVYYVGINVEAHAGKFARNNIIQNNTVYRTRGSVGNSDGIAVKSNVEPSGVIGNKVIGNVVFDTFDDGIDCWNSRDTLVEGNLVYNIKNGDGNGIKAGKSYGCIVVGNIAHDCKSAGLTSNGSGVRFEGNVSYNNATGFSDNWRQAGYEKEKSYFLNNVAYGNGKNFAWGSQSVDEGGNVTVKPAEPIEDYMRAIGTDVSFYQDDPSTPTGINFDVMALAGAAFTIIRAGQWSWVDRDFKKNWQAAKAAGIPRGSYWFYDSRGEPKKQAQLWVNTLAGDLGELPLFADFEDTFGGAWGKWKDWYDFLVEVKRLVPGKEVAIYTAYSYWTERTIQKGISISSLAYFKQYPLWVANYDVSSPLVPLPWGKNDWTFWQFTDRGDGKKYGAESHRIDLNYFNGTEAELHARFGLDGHVPASRTILARWNGKLVEYKEK